MGEILIILIASAILYDIYDEGADSYNLEPKKET